MRRFDSAPKPHSSGAGQQATAPLPIVAAMAANLIVAAAKFAAAAISGSVAMSAEGVHSLVDTGNQGLLLFGVKRSVRAPDASHPFGYGKEIYFWALIYSGLLFSLGGGVAIYEGVEALIHPSAPESGFVYSYLVLAVALLAEGISWFVALRAVKRDSPGVSLRVRLRNATDPSNFVVVAEDTSAILGALIAMLGVGLSQATDSHFPDAAASVLIGLVLCAAAVALAVRLKELLVGQSAPAHVVKSVQRLVEQEPNVRRCGFPLTMMLGPKDLLAAINVQLIPSNQPAEVAKTVDRIEATIRRRFPEFTRIYIEVQLGEADIRREELSSD